MESKFEKRSPEIPTLLDLLADYRVNYILVGSVAVGAYGVTIPEPGDLDIVPELIEENLSRLRDFLSYIEAQPDAESFGYWTKTSNGEYRWVTNVAAAEDSSSREDWHAKPQDWKTFDHLFLSRYGNFDVVPRIAGSYERLVQRVQHLSVYGRLVPVAQLDELLAHLTVPRREKDVLKVQELRRVQFERGKVSDHP